MALAVALVTAYAIGSIPFGYLVTRVLLGSDIRSIGSGGTGATNVQRALGWRWGLGIALADVIKGVLVVVVARALGAPDLVVASSATLAVAGHCWPIWLGFKGGKGVATGGGAAFALTPWTLILIPIIVIPVVLTRFVSLGSITAALVTPMIFIVLAIVGTAPGEYVVFGFGAALIVVAKHRANIERLRAGTERRIGDAREGVSTA